MTEEQRSLLESLDDIIKADPNGESAIYKQLFLQAVKAGVLDEEGYLLVDPEETNEQ